MATRLRFIRGMKIVIPFRHKNLVAVYESAATDDVYPVYDVGEVDGVPYISMAYIEGHPLTEYVSREEPLAENAVAILASQLAQGLRFRRRRSQNSRKLRSHDQ